MCMCSPESRKQTPNDKPNKQTNKQKYVKHFVSVDKKRIQKKKNSF